MARLSRERVFQLMRHWVDQMEAQWIYNEWEFESLVCAFKFTDPSKPEGESNRISNGLRIGNTDEQKLQIGKHAIEIMSAALRKHGKALDVKELAKGLGIGLHELREMGFTE